MASEMTLVSATSAADASASAVAALGGVRVTAIG